PARPDHRRGRVGDRLRGRDRGRRVHHARWQGRLAAAAGGGGMSAELVAQLTVLVLAAFVGIEVISKVPTTLHTPLMSGTNAIAFGAINVVGGFLVTDRMLNMFKRRPGDGERDG